MSSWLGRQVGEVAALCERLLVSGVEAAYVVDDSVSIPLRRAHSRVVEWSAFPVPRFRDMRPRRRRDEKVWVENGHLAFRSTNRPDLSFGPSGPEAQVSSDLRRTPTL